MARSLLNRSAVVAASLLDEDLCEDILYKANGADPGVSIRCIWREYESAEPRDSDGGRVDLRRAVATVLTSDVPTPGLADTITRGSDVWRVEAVDENRVLSRLIVRRSTRIDRSAAKVTEDRV